MSGKDRNKACGKALLGAASIFYDLALGAAQLALARHPRLAGGFAERTLKTGLPGPADVWIQAASVGESLLAREVLHACDPAWGIRFHLTSNTDQGLDMLRKICADPALAGRNVSASCGYFPLDRPRTMSRFVKALDPGAALILETEIWPGMLLALKKAGTPIILANGRMRPQSLSRYMLGRGLLRALRPDHILAVSEADALRFAALFGDQGVEVMPNIKFDRVGETRALPASANPVSRVVGQRAPFLVLGSVRREEEDKVEAMIRDLRARLPETTIGLFPRHMDRVAHWEGVLAAMDAPCARRSAVEKPVAQGSVVIWDTFGELAHAFARARAAFVGGSLVPLGGQNFLEAAAAGLRPVIGPHWDNFHWVGEDFFARGLGVRAEDERQAADILAGQMRTPTVKPAVRKQVAAYVRERRGGSALVSQRIAKALGKR